jgi:hypothetical protein
MNLKGTFWLSSNKEEVFEGEIGHDDEFGYYLEIYSEKINLRLLTSTLINRKNDPLDKDGYCINGTISSSKDISLICVKQFYGNRIYFHYLFEGIHINNLTEVESTRYEFTFKDIEKWITRNGFKFDEESQFSFDFKEKKFGYKEIHPEIFYEKNKIKILLKNNLSSERNFASKALTIKDENYFLIESEEPIDFKTLIKKKAEIYNFIKLFSGCFFKPNSTEFRLKDKNVILKSSDDLLARHDLYEKEDVLFYSENKDKFKNYFEKFVELFEKDGIGDIINLYYTTIYTPNISGNNRFLNFCQILESYHTLTHRNGNKFDRITKRKLDQAWCEFLDFQNDEIKKYLTVYFIPNNSISFKNRLLDIAIEFFHIMSHIHRQRYHFNNNFDIQLRKSSGIDLIVNTRNYLTHLNSSKNVISKYETGECSEYLQSIFETLLLKDIGLNEDTLKKMWEPSSTSHLRRRVGYY